MRTAKQYLSDLRDIKAKAGESEMEKRAKAEREAAKEKARESLKELRPIPNEIRRKLNGKCSNPWCQTPEMDICVEIIDGKPISVCKRHLNPNNEHFSKEDL